MYLAMKIGAVLLAANLTAYAFVQDYITGYAIDGYVVGEHGEPLTNVTVRLTRIAVGQPFEVKTDKHGNYIHTGLPPGDYLLSVTIDGRTFSLGTHLGIQETLLITDRIIEHYVRASANINFDLRQLAFDTHEEQKVTVDGLKIPRKAQQEFKSAFAAKDDVEAKRHLENAIKIAPDYEEALNSLASLYYRRKQYEEAAALYERASNSNPNSVIVRLNLATTLLQLRRFEEALEQDLHVLQSHSNDALAHGQAGIALSQLRRFDEAFTQLEQAKQLSPTSPLLPGYVLGVLYDDLGRVDDAIVEFADFLKANPEYVRRGEIQYRMQQLCEQGATQRDVLSICAQAPLRHDP
jgi:thioredoxin-like negative regulator of GroEL